MRLPVESTPPPPGISSLHGNKRDKKKFDHAARTRLAMQKFKAGLESALERTGMMILPLLTELKMLAAALKEAGVEEGHNAAIVEYAGLEEFRMGALAAAAKSAGLENEYRDFEINMMSYDDIFELIKKLSEGQVASEGVMALIQSPVLGEPEVPVSSLSDIHQDPSWMVRELSTVGLQKLFQGALTVDDRTVVSLGGLKEFVHFGRDTYGELYGLLAGAQGNAALQFDGKDNVSMVQPDKMYDCFDGIYAVAKIMRANGVNVELYYGQTDVFARDVFAQVTLEDGTVFRISMVPSMQAIEEVKEGVDSQWRNIQHVPWEAAEEIASSRSHAVRFDLMRPGGEVLQPDGVSYKLTSAGFAKEGDNRMKLTVKTELINGRSVQTLSQLTAIIPLSAMRQEGETTALIEALKQARENGDRAELGEALRRAGKEADRETLIQALRIAGGSFQSLGDSTEGLKELEALARLPLKAGPLKLPAPMRPARNWPGPVSDLSISALPAFVRWEQVISTVSETTVVVLPSSILSRLSSEELAVLAALPSRVKNQLVLVEMSKEQDRVLDLLRKSLTVVDVDHLAQFAQSLPAGTRIRVLGVREGDATFLQLKSWLGQVRVVPVPLAGGLKEFLLSLRTALGLPEYAVDQEIEQLIMAFRDPLSGQV